MDYFKKPVYYLEGTDFENGKLKYNLTKPIVVMIHGNNCPHCVDAKPAFQQAAEENLDILWMGIQTDVRDGLNALKGFLPNFNKGIPSYYVIDRNKNVTEFNRGRDLKSLNELAATLRNS